MSVTRRQAILAVMATPLAQPTGSQTPGTLILDLRRWNEVVVIRSDFKDGQIALSMEDIWDALLSAR